MAPALKSDYFRKGAFSTEPAGPGLPFEFWSYLKAALSLRGRNDAEGHVWTAATFQFTLPD